MFLVRILKRTNYFAELIILSIVNPAASDKQFAPIDV